MKIGFVSMPLSGHLNPMTALARRLQSRGNEVVFFGVPDVEPFARAAGLDFVPYGGAEFPVGSIEKLYSSVATMRGFEVVRHSVMDLNLGITRVVFDHLGEKLATTGVEAVVIDTIHFFAELVPLSMSIPYVHIWNVLHLDFSGATPSSLFSDPLDSSPAGLKRNAENLGKIGAILGPLEGNGEVLCRKGRTQNQLERSCFDSFQVSCNNSDAERIRFPRNPLACPVSLRRPVSRR